MLSQTKIRVFAFNRATAAPVIGDAANITATWAKDYSEPTEMADANPSEIGLGYYYFDLSENERDVAIIGEIFPVSSTSGVQVMGDPGFLHAQTLIDSFSVTRIGPEYNAATRTITLIAGDDYLAGNGNALTFAVTFPGVDLSAATAVYGGSGDYLDLLQGSAELIDINTDTPKLRLQWTRAQTNRKPSPKYCWGVAIIIDRKVQTVVGGNLILKPPLVPISIVDAELA